MDKRLIREKFGGDYRANDITYKLGIDIRFADHLASRFESLTVLETCTGGGFSSIALAKYAAHVYTFEIDDGRCDDAQKNAEIAGVESKLTFVNDDVLGVSKYGFAASIDAAFLDPDWADTEPDHRYSFVNSTTIPPSDSLFEMVLEITSNITLVQPPFIDTAEFAGLPPHELEYLYMNDVLELYCLHFGSLVRVGGKTEFRV
jgi:hypothetical protein